MRKVISSCAFGLLLALTASCGRTTVHYSREELADALSDADAQSEAGLSLGEFALAPGAVVDGDTLKVGGLDASLRLLGLDTEETFKSEKDLRLYESLGFEAYMAKKGEGTDRPAKCATPLGDAAKKFAQAFFAGDITVRLERDDPKDMRGRFGRLLTYVFVKRGDEWINYNVEAVRAGMSPYFTKYGYSRRFHDEFVQAQKEAREAKIGIWDPSLEHYRDYDQRLEWWDARGEFIARFEKDAEGRDDMIMLGHWDALDRIAALEGKEVEILAGVGEIYPGEGARPTRVMLSRRMFSDFQLIFFDEDVVLSSRIEEAKGEFVRVRGTVSAYTYKSRRRRDEADRTQLQIEVKVAQQVIISDTAPGAPSRTPLQPAPQPEDAPDPYEAVPDAPPAPPPAPDAPPALPEDAPALDRTAEDTPTVEADPVGALLPMIRPWTAHSRRLAALCLLASASACGDDSARTGGGGECAANLLPGDLVITEVMANPAGADKGLEWFEVYNPTDAEIDLSGLLLRFRREDGSGEKLHQVQDAVIGPGQYLVFGDADPEAPPAHVDYGYGEGLGASGLNNSGGELSVACGTSAIDVILYEEVGDSVSRTFDGTREPDAAGNDDLEAWCDAATEYAEGSFGTPGTANDPCYSEQPTTCSEGGTMRDLVPPSPGDIVITEYMPNPDAVGDDEGEWFEIYVANDFDLNGLAITKFGDEEPTDIIGSVDCMPAAAGSYLLFAHSADSTVNGGLPAVDHLFTLSMSNTSENGTGISVGWGGQLLDTVTWTSSGTGISSQLNPMLLDPTRNDEEDAFCRSQDPYGDGDLGSPGVANPPCKVDAPEGSCADASGVLREIVAPSVGDLWITEFLPNPDAVSDPDGEWFEVYANAAFDLNALEFGRDEEVEEEIDLDTCAPVEAGERILFAKNAESVTNGGLPAVDYEFSLSLLNSNGRLFVSTGGEVLDAITWSSSTAGAARSLDPSVSGPEANDAEANWCDAEDPYGDGDLGTPADENQPCGGTPAGTCDDGGRIRDVVPPTAGDLVITEWMPNPDAVTDANGEWFEVLVSANVDLNGLQLGDDPENPDTMLSPTGDCIAVASGTRVVFARNADTLTNGGLESAIEASFTLGNTSGTLFVGIGDEVLDQIAYTSSSTGSSTSVSAGSEDPAGNDDELNHCESNTPYGDGDNGTPGAENACE